MFNPAQRPPQAAARRRRIAIGALTISACVIATAPHVAAAATTKATPLTKAGGDATAAGRVIVVLHNQLPTLKATPAHANQRRTVAVAEQNKVLAKLSSRPSHVTHFSVGNAFAATVTSTELAELKVDPAVADVYASTTIAVPPATPAKTTSTSGITPNTSGALSPTPSTTAGGTPSQVCSFDPSKPQLDPEGLALTHTNSDDGSPSAANYVDGSGVKVAVIADGIDTETPDLIRADGTHVITDYEDFTGDGNSDVGGGESAGDASTIAAQGTVVHDLGGNDQCPVKVVGAAPGASLVVLRAGGEAGLPDSAIMQAIDYAVSVSHVNVINESFGANYYPDSGSRNALELFNVQAVAAGVTIVVSSGDAGTTSTIGTPANDPNLISVGASTALRLSQQLTYNATRTVSPWANNNIAEFSSSGFTQDGRTIDLVAPGFAGWAACTSRMSGCDHGVFEFAGTSQSAPFVSGAAALVIQAYRQTHDGASPTPALVKQLLLGTTTDLGFESQHQGTGLLNSLGAVKAALTYNATTAPPVSAGSQLLTSQSQVDLSGLPGTTRSGTLTLTNTGSTALTVAPALRKIIPLSDSTVSGAPTDRTVSLTVPPGADELHVTMTGPSFFGWGYYLREPDGTVANIASPQAFFPGAANFLVAHPVAGKWSLDTYSAAVTVDVATYRWAPVGAGLSASVIVPAHGTKTLAFSVPTSTSGGDSSYSLALASSNGNTTTVPIVMRTLLPMTATGGTFSGSLVGGNGRAQSPSATSTYQFTVPAGQPVLDVSTVINPGADKPDTAEVLLIDPHGEVPSVAMNLDATQTPSTGIHQVVQKPMAGTWRLVVVTAGAVNSLSQSFTGTIGFQPTVRATADLPNGFALPKGKATAVTLTVTNPGPSTLYVQTDARLDAMKTLPLAPFSLAFPNSWIRQGSTVQMPDSPSLDYLVPPGTQAVTASSSSTVANQVDLQSPSFGIEVMGNLAAAKQGSTVSSAKVSETTPTVSPGIWSASVTPAGVFGATRLPSTSATLTATARTAGFNRDITSTTGDQYLVGVDPTYPVLLRFGAVAIPPGATARIPVTITPTGAVGSTVTGRLNVTTEIVTTYQFNSSFGPFFTFTVPETGSVLASLPYSYTITK